MSGYTGQDNGTLRVTISEAASRLGVTEAAIRKRTQRGSLDKEMGENGRVYVYLDLYQDICHPESQVDHEPLVEELQDRVRFLERELDRRSVEAERCQHIVAGLARANANPTDRLKELEAPAREPGAFQEAPGGSPSAAGRNDRKDHPRPGGEEVQEPRERPFTEKEPEPRGFWSRLFGG